MRLRPAIAQAAVAQCAGSRAHSVTVGDSEKLVLSRRPSVVIEAEAGAMDGSGVGSPGRGVAGGEPCRDVGCVAIERTLAGYVLLAGRKLLDRARLAQAGFRYLRLAGLRRLERLAVRSFIFSQCGRN